MFGINTPSIGLGLSIHMFGNTTIVVSLSRHILNFNRILINTKKMPMNVCFFYYCYAKIRQRSTRNAVGDTSSPVMKPKEEYATRRRDF